MKIKISKETNNKTENEEVNFLKKPKVDILLSVYKPNREFLIKQLQSLNRQTYQNVEVIINDDCPSDKCDVSIFEKYLTDIPFKILSSETNLGYIKSFEKLSKEATGEYVAYCDQDDIWREDKIEKSVSVLQDNPNVLVAVSDRKLIDKNDCVICESVKKQNKHNSDNYKINEICKRNFFLTYVPGMCIVAKTNFIKSIIPFSLYTGHDKWILACASVDNKIIYINETLAYYRRHDGNATGVLEGINDKNDYLKKRIYPCINLINEFLELYPNFSDKREVIEFAYARLNHDIIKLYKYHNLAPSISAFELLIYWLPDFMFKFSLKMIRKL